MEALQNKKVIFAAQQAARLVAEAFDPNPAAGEVVGKTLVSVISSGSEIGGYMNYYGGGVYPCPTGYAGVMRVQAVGAGVEDVQPGDLVFSQSPHQLYVRVPAAEVVPVPAGMEPEHAVLARFPAVSMTTMIKTQIRPTEPVLVAGLGIIGLTCAQMMRRCGYPVHAVDPAPARRQTAAECGLESTAATIEELAALKGKIGLAIDCSGNDDATLGLIGMVRRGGEVSLVGVPWRSTSPVVVNALFRAIFNGYVTLYSGWEWSLPLHPQPFLPNSNFGSFAAAMDWIRRGDIRVAGIYELRNPADCAAVYDAISKGQAAKTCTMFDWRAC